MKSEVRTDSRKRLNRINGQILGLLKMIDDKRTCAEILQQVVAVRSALDQLGIALLAEHVQTCVLHQGTEHPEDRCQELPEEDRSAEIRSTLKRFLK
ncbi:MAG TPA: metal-sensitive transcriptional regulator [Fimbriimonadaceae bacterium]|nr:metal-sensitive transcriptional regulator [Fimbriimonadaceae bacterium]